MEPDARTQLSRVEWEQKIGERDGRLREKDKLICEKDEEIWEKAQQISKLKGGNWSEISKLKDEHRLKVDSLREELSRLRGEIHSVKLNEEGWIGKAMLRQHIGALTFFLSVCVCVYCR